MAMRKLNGVDPVPVHHKIESKMVLISRRCQPSFQSFKTVLLKLLSFYSTFALIICCILLVLSVVAATVKPLNKVIHVVLISTVKPPLFATNEKFLSTALDSVLISQGFPRFNMSDPKLVELMKPLAPGYLRIGGNMADRLWFQPNDEFVFKNRYVSESDGGECSNEQRYCDQYDRPNFTMSGREWIQLNQLAQKANLTILFDLNCLIRFPNGSWNSKNAEELIKFSDSHRFNIIWQLGNEPNAFRHVFNYEVNATQLSQDFKQLRNILNRYASYNTSLLVGPDTTRPIPKHKESMKYLYEFLINGKDTIGAITWHQYYFNGKTASLINFLDPDVFNLLETQIKFIKQIVRNVGAHNKPIWLGETSSAYGGGAPGYSDRYVSTFIWLDKLGVAALNGLDLVVRQTLFGSNYALIDSNLNPLPDWWLSVIYKQLVGPEVIPCYIASSNSVRLYCHCTKKNIYGNYLPSSLIVFGFNLKSTEAHVRIQDYNSQVLAYILSPNGSLVSRYITLNGKVLSVFPNGSLPIIKPVLMDSTPYLVIPPYSLVFWVIPISVNGCM